MNQLELSNSYVEVLEILKYAPIEIRFKIPYRIKRLLKEKHLQHINGNMIKRKDY